MFRVFILIVVIVFFVPVSALCEKFIVITENNPPFSYEENQIVKGLATDILIELMELSDIPLERSDIKVWPWMRGFKTLKSQEDVLLYTVARTPERENMFQWVGPIYEVKQCIMALGDCEIADFTFNDFSKIRIGTLRGSSSETLLFDSGIRLGTVESLHDPELNIKKMLKGRLDAVAFSEIAARHMLVSLGYDPDKLKILYQYGSVEYYIGLNIKAAPKVVERLQESLDYLKTNGRVDDIINGYMNKEERLSVLPSQNAH